VKHSEINISRRQSTAGKYGIKTIPGSILLNLEKWSRRRISWNLL